MSNWLEVTIPATPETLDDLTAQLSAHGFDSFQIVDRRDLELSRPSWELFDEDLLQNDDCRLVLYLSPSATDDLARLRDLCPALTQRERNEEEWADAWKQYYRPTPVGSRLLIQPAWLPLENRENRAVFLNNPGMSFGTGLHASTRLCLEMLEAMNLRRGRVLDVGCGSGILGLAALVLGAEHAVGIDIDPTAAETARQNAALNGVENRFTALAGDFLSDDALRRSVGVGFDVVFSNIVADIVIALAPLLAPTAKVWVASGIIEPRLEDVLAAAARTGLRTGEVLLRDGWAAVRWERL